MIFKISGPLKIVKISDTLPKTVFFAHFYRTKLSQFLSSFGYIAEKSEKKLIFKGCLRFVQFQKA